MGGLEGGAWGEGEGEGWAGLARINTRGLKVNGLWQKRHGPVVSLPHPVMLQSHLPPCLLIPLVSR